MYIVKAGDIIQLLTLIIVFALVLAITYFTTRWIANYQSKATGKGNIEIIEVKRLTTNKCIEIVKIAGEYYAIASGKDEINVIDKLNKENINIPEVNKSSLSMESFKKVFAKVKKNKDNKE